MSSVVANVPTTHASKYLQQLCKHWQHNLAVEFTPEASGSFRERTKVH